MVNYRQTLGCYPFENYTFNCYDVFSHGSRSITIPDIKRYKGFLPNLVRIHTT